jgi:hypothetical protein
MSDTATGDVSTETFGELTPQERAKQAAEEAADKATGNGGFLSGLRPSLDVDAADVAGRFVKERGSGMPVGDIAEEYGIPEGPAYVIRGVMRMTGADGVPPIADVAVGLLKTIRSKRSGGGE